MVIYVVYEAEFAAWPLREAYGSML